ncbi:VOC family protein [Sphingomonas sp. BIUV-7]|uniref:Bleomycin resistance protein n=1 Tax=Sphingomonas natans TaxID=3063330 RepID=A0ABT8Y8M8_9SPHN|nr:VOC family protein [Sphingomonas sp. BIUV-7]MDO6414669.1 VOC family protein [Sphingomonas sp. BIUV-7]
MPLDEPVLLAAEPQLFVGDLPAALSFYLEQLGFTLVFAHGNPPFYAQVRRGGARLNLREVPGPVFSPGFRLRERDALSATITVEDIDALARDYDAAGIDWHQRPRTEPWGARTCIVRDPDGNLIAFAGDPG